MGNTISEASITPPRRQLSDQENAGVTAQRRTSSLKHSAQQRYAASLDSSALFHGSLAETGTTPFGLAIAPVDLCSLNPKKMESSSASSKSPNTGPVKGVPTLVTWAKGGGAVYVTGTFNNWRRKLRLHKRYLFLLGVKVDDPA